LKRLVPDFQKLVLGPLDSRLPGPMSLELTLDGDWVKEAKISVGKNRRNIEEKLCSQKWGSLSMASRWIDPLNSVFCERLVCEAVEVLCEVEVSTRAETIRDIVCDLALISNHLLYLSTIAREVEAKSAYHFLLRDREGILDLIELLTGARQSNHFIRIGGVQYDLSEGFIDRAVQLLTTLRIRRQEYQNTWVNSTIWIDRTFGLAVITEAQAQALQMCGPNLVASLIEYSGKGDVFCRVQTRLDQIDQTVERNLERLENLPEGHFQVAPIPKDFVAPTGEVSHQLEGPRGELGIILSSQGRDHPSRIRITQSSSSAIQAIEQALKKVWLEDVFLVIQSFDLNLGEVDL
jgi:NADH-quinone oxidoreductase subunit D